MANIDVQIIWLEEISKKFGTAPIWNALHTGIKKVTIFFQWESIKEAPVDTGVLRNKISVSFKFLQGRVYNSSKYGDFTHEGTKPHFPPLQYIKPWALRKWLNPWAVALSISRKWTKENRYFDRAAQWKDNVVDSIMSREVDSLIAKYL